MNVLSILDLTYIVNKVYTYFNLATCYFNLKFLLCNRFYNIYIALTICITIEDSIYLLSLLIKNYVVH